MIPYPQARRNEQLNAIDILLATPFIVLITQYAPVLVAQLGASSLLLGLLTSGSALVVTLGAIFGPAWLQRSSRYRVVYGIPGLIWRFVTFVIPLALLLPSYRAEAIVIATILFSLFSGFANFAFTAYLPRMTLPDRVGKLVSMRWTMLGVGMCVTTPLLAALLDSFAQPVNYWVVCTLSFALVMGSWVALMMTQPAPVVNKVAQRQSISLRQLRGHSSAWHYILVSLLIHSAINAAGPLITLQMVRVLNASNSQFGWYLAIFWAAMALFGLITPRLIQRWGNVKIFAASAIGLAVQLVILAIAPNLAVTWAASFIAGVASVLFQVSSYALLVECAPPNLYEGYVSWHTITINIALFAAPLIMSAMVDAGLAIWLGLLICAALRALAGVVAWQMIKPTQPDMASSF
ncbi:MAG: MFS transporter [Anaerolineae bacterium]|nr:MFS transporter [Anaerolineae bacterium]